MSSSAHGIGLRNLCHCSRGGLFYHTQRYLRFCSPTHSVGLNLELYDDSRVYPRIKTETIGLCLLFGFLFRMPSLKRLEYWIRSGTFRRLAKGHRLPSVDTIRDSLKGTDLEQLQLMNEQVVKKTRRNKVLREGTIDGWVVSAIDGVELFESVKKAAKKH